VLQYLDTEGLQKVRRSYNNSIYVHQKEAPTRISVNIHLPPLSLFLLYLLYITNFTNTSAFKTVIWTPGTPQKAQQNIKALPAPANPSSYSQRGAFLSEPNPTCDRRSRHGRSINHRAPPCSHHHLLHSPKVSRPQGSRIRLQTAADNSHRRMLAQKKKKKEKKRFSCEATAARELRPGRTHSRDTDSCLM